MGFMIAVNETPLIEKRLHLRKSLRFALLWCALSQLPRVAHANGRFPAANQVVFDPTRSEHLLLTTTFGLVETWDAGKTFSWTCESAFGLMGESDAMLAITAPAMGARWTCTSNTERKVATRWRGPGAT